jgi:hypothetical protein
MLVVVLLMLLLMVLLLLGLGDRRTGSQADSVVVINDWWFRVLKLWLHQDQTISQLGEDHS